MSKEAERNCGSCGFFLHDKNWCRRNPPVPVDNRHSRYPTTSWLDWCGEWQIRNELLKPKTDS